MTIDTKVQSYDGFCLGIDVGSTTVKLALTKGGRLSHSCYERHMAQVKETVLKELGKISPVIGDSKFKVALSGSAGLGLAHQSGIPFVQEVFATTELVRTIEDDVSAVIELGGEDAKVIFFKGGVDERMNGSCAGGTGAFIDQMASLLNITNAELDELSLQSTKIYPIASRCGVFAKTDLQALLNQGANKADICASIYQSIVNQTIAGLAQGKKIEGKVLFLGGPLTFCRGLRKRFIETLKLEEGNAVFPEYSSISVALGAGIYARTQDSEFVLDELIEKVKGAHSEIPLANTAPALFENDGEYDEFKERHSRSQVKEGSLEGYSGKAYLGIDCGSTTTKLVVISDDDSLIYSYYSPNKGNPVSIIKEQLEHIYSVAGPGFEIASSCVTGYGEDLIRAAFKVDSGLVETLAHYRSARYFNPDVNYILDIGGQDIKCFRIEHGAISSISLNEACSSGCGSFLQTFATSLGYTVEEFARLGLKAKHPVNLGSRCTVFMNSSVKQAQKDGACVEDLSAGLSISVVKNALYKVIRETNAEALGDNVVVQGGTFLNDCVLRAFEMELGKNVIRPKIAGLMGAFGCALHAKEYSPGKTTIISAEELSSFIHEIEVVKCTGCGNGCNLNINRFADGRQFISGNNCEKGLNFGKPIEGKKEIPNLYEFKRGLLTKIMRNDKKEGAPTVGLPLCLGMYEFAPFWREFFDRLGFNVVLSGFTTKGMVARGQYTIPSDTVCYPAKVMHGHMLSLVSRGVDMIFYPSLTFNIDEGYSDNKYNCPVVAYYGELLDANLEDLKQTRFLFPYLNINNHKQLAKELEVALKDWKMSRKEISKALECAEDAYRSYKEEVRQEGDRVRKYIEENGMNALVFIGRPYHIDPEVCHGIDKLANETGFAVLSEDSLPMRKTEGLKVYNQWTFHSRLYNAAQFATEHDNIDILQLVSFGCGLDAITTDEVKRILEEKNKLYTQIKIDEITNLGAVKIRMRSLKGVLDERNLH